jgi:hypothetical protein
VGGLDKNINESTLTMKFTYHQAKIDLLRNRSNNKLLRIKALLIELLLQHQCRDPTFHLLPTEDGLMTGVITKANKIPTDEKDICKYVKENA